jgi:hypothetical protein
MKQFKNYGRAGLDEDNNIIWPKKCDLPAGYLREEYIHKFRVFST